MPTRKGEERPGRPMPVRVLMEGSTEETPLAERVFDVAGAEWTARVIGSTSAGTAPDVRAPLLLIGFARASAPDAIEREAMAAVPSLEHLSDPQLADLFSASRPPRGPEGKLETA